MLARLAPGGIKRLHDTPEAPGMVELGEVRDLMSHDVVGEHRL
jgi:hypothetical protein